MLGGPHVATLCTVFQGRDVDLVCGECGANFARVRLRPFALGIDVRSLVTGERFLPRPGYSINEEARQRLAQAENGAGDVAAARGVVQYLRAHGGDIVYDLTCRCRRRYVRTSPGLRREITATKGGWVTLSPATATWPPPTT